MNIIAPTKIGKSWLVLDLAMAVATGRAWLGTFPTEPGNVLLIDNELHRETLSHRLHRVAEARGISARELETAITVVPLRGRLRDLKGLTAALANLHHHHFALCIVDAFYRTLPIDTDENV